MRNANNSDGMFADPQEEDETSAAGTGDFARELGELVGLGLDVARSLRRLADAQAQLAEMAVATARDASASGAPPGEDAGGDAKAAEPTAQTPGAGLALAALQRLAGLGDMGLSFSRVAQSVRLTVALTERLKLGPEAFAPPAPRAAGRRQAEDDSAARLREEDATGEYLKDVALRKFELDLCVERAIETCAPESEHRRLLADMSERIFECDTDERFLERPIDELVAKICKDLGLPADPAIWNQPDDDPPDPVGSQRPIRQMRGPDRSHCVANGYHRRGFYPGSLWARAAANLLIRRSNRIVQAAAQAEAALKAARMAEGP
jgi:hypothetical protein